MKKIVSLFLIAAYLVAVRFEVIDSMPCDDPQSQLLAVSKKVKREATTKKSEEKEANEASKEERWFEQYLDHFDVWDNRTFKMRYFESDEFYKHGGPILIDVGGEEDAFETWKVKLSPTFRLAKLLHAKVVMVEHRYYGKSVPFDFDDMDLDELIYLSVDQALEDLAYFIESYKRYHEDLRDSKVAVFGCSYAGALATWFRYKFPHLASAAWASGAPLHAKLNFSEYYEVASEMYANVSGECVDVVRRGYREIKTQLTTPQGEERIKAALKDWECGNVTEMTNLELLANVRSILANQYNGANFSEDSCMFLQKKNETTRYLDHLAAFILMVNEDVCFETDDNDDFAWVYQICTQLGYSFTTESKNQPFEDSSFSAIDAQMEECKELFGEEFNIDIAKRGIDRLNRVYGSYHLEATRVLTIQGTRDPWHKLGLHHQQHTKDDEMPVFFITGASHCADMTWNLEQQKELPDAEKVLEQAFEIFQRWLTRT